MAKVRAVSAVIVAGVVLTACGGSSGSLFNDDQGTGQGGATAAPAGGSSDTGTFSTDPIGTGAACVTSTTNARLPPVNLVIMYDKSGSMGDPAEGGDPNARWIPVNTGMKSFFADPASAAYSASLQFFPAPGDMAATCSAPYATPKVPLTSLSNAAPLVAALDGTSPQGGTPTLPALQGAITYAQSTLATHPDEKTVVVLVTDGYPGLMVNGQFVPGCADNDIPHIADVAKQAFTATPSVPTYVIGVGPALGNLDQLAAAGGTAHAFMISVSDPAQTKTDLEKALTTIRGSVELPCDFAVPAPPDGEALDKDRVNVAFTTGAGAETPLGYDAACTSNAGWHYDNPAAPTRIALCPSACRTAQADSTGKLTIAFGCRTTTVTK